MVESMVVEPVTLEGRRVRLEPIGHEHADDLVVAAGDRVIWRYIPLDPSSTESMRTWIDGSIADREAGTVLRFAIVDRASGRAVGSTSLFDIRPKDRGIEIGWTWLGRDAQRTGINTECKHLLLRHCFETLGAIRVQLKTHRLNFESRRAIERIGAQFEGILRNHTIMPDGSYRDSAYYSIIECEWPAVRRHLELMMAGGEE
ncbi:MAG: N-acetyltransferase [Thermomicrobiales bacterium]|nr:N-acetyltransferase [Thermomicrobiales bacterium]